MWMARYELDPWGEQRADYRNALSIVLALQAAGVKKRFTVDDFMHFRNLPQPEEIDEAAVEVHPVEALLTKIADEGQRAERKEKREAGKKSKRTKR